MVFCLVFEYATENCAMTAYAASQCAQLIACLPTGPSSQVSLHSTYSNKEQILVSTGLSIPLQNVQWDMYSRSLSNGTVML